MWNGQESGNQGDLFVPALYEAGSLDYPAFSFYLGLEEEDSYIDFGEPNFEAFDLDGYFDVEAIDSEDEWSNYVSGFHIHIDGETEVEFDYQRAYLDTQNNCISGPTDIVEIIYDRILDATTIYNEDELYQHLFKCSDIDNLPSFSLHFGENWMEISPSSYTIQTGTNTDECFVCLRHDEELDFWSLGLPFMRQWYTVFDYEENTMGFVRHPDFESVVEDDVIDQEALWYDYVSVAGGFTFSVGVIYYLYQ